MFIAIEICLIEIKTQREVTDTGEVLGTPLHPIDTWITHLVFSTRGSIVHISPAYRVEQVSEGFVELSCGTQCIGVTAFSEGRQH